MNLVYNDSILWVGDGQKVGKTHHAGEQEKHCVSGVKTYPEETFGG